MVLAGTDFSPTTPQLRLPGCRPATKESGGAKSVLVIAESSALAMKKVLAAEGTVTHELPILNAVGAELEPISIKVLSEDPQILVSSSIVMTPHVNRS